MIKHLKINNFVLIESAEFSFTKNLNILIGETGGGKSLVFRAISQILGERAQASYIRKGQNKYEISAVFTNTKEIIDALVEQQIQARDELTITRSFDKNGNSKIVINGELVNLSRLREVTKSIADVVLQKDNNQQLEEQSLFDLLNIDQQNYAQYLEEFEQYQSLKKEHAKLQKQLLNKEEEQLIINHRLKSFAKLDFKIDFANAVTKIQNADDVLANINKYRQISEGVDRAAACLYFAKEIDPEIEEQLYSLKDQLEDLSYKLSGKLASDISENEIEHLKNNVSIARKLSRQFDCEMYHLIDIHENLQQKKLELDSVDIDLVNIENKLSKQKQVLSDAWTELAKQIHLKAEQICTVANKMFKNVEMPKATIKFNFTELEDFSILGKYRINLFIDANGLDKFGDVNEHASGGEFSRLLLILKSLDERNQNRLLMFDEIDTGISGYTAQKMIRLIQKIAKKNQILLITHLAQSAAAANQMYEIEKVDGRSSAKMIHYQQMPQIISKLLSGSEITTEAIRQAQILIEEVQDGSDYFSS